MMVGISQFLCGMRHVFYFCGISSRQFKCVFLWYSEFSLAHERQLCNKSGWNTLERLYNSNSDELLAFSFKLKTILHSTPLLGHSEAALIKSDEFGRLKDH